MIAIRSAERASAPAQISVKNQPMKARESSIALAPLARADRREDALHDGDGSGRAAGNGDVHRDHVRDAAAARVALAENAARTAAVADRHHELRVGSGLPGALERGLHVARYRAGHQEHVRVPRARDELDAETLEIVVGAVHRVDLELA